MWRTPWHKVAGVQSARGRKTDERFWMASKPSRLSKRLPKRGIHHPLVNNAAVVLTAAMAPQGNSDGSEAKNFSLHLYGRHSDIVPAATVEAEPKTATGL